MDLKRPFEATAKEEAVASCSLSKKVAKKAATPSPRHQGVVQMKPAAAGIGQLQLVSTTDGGVTTLVAMASVLSPVLGAICHMLLTDGASCQQARACMHNTVISIASMGKRDCEHAWCSLSLKKF